eukprot:TRINITY_DN6350_c0_g1_i1.p1 TRINITY_DN6350_c0_g1~~TRINITY_DN6350_c0_g1_i1.p1  ORF type:complete len:501 (+),score=64.21 TRINITY_DN6350_c0_g1_i1:125-1504(+)
MKFSWMSGGFIGVDVFFVISGYLVLGKLLQDTLDREVSLNGKYVLDFFARRLKRLLIPSSVCLVLVLVGCFVIEPYHLWRSSLRDIAMAGLHVTNIWFFLESAKYFSDDKAKSLVLHYWSLSLEEQIYLVLPFLVLAYSGICYFLRKPKTRLSLFTFFGILMVLSCGSIFFLHEGAAKYYLPPTRLWQFIVGGITHQLEEKMRFLQKIPKFVSLLLLLLLFLSGCFVQPQDYPNVNSIFIVILASLIICVRMPTVPVLDTLGDWSYSIYLYHWPVILFLEPIFLFHRMLHGTFIWNFQHFGLFGVLSLFGFHVVERGSRKISWKNTTWFLIFLGFLERFIWELPVWRHYHLGSQKWVYKIQHLPRLIPLLPSLLILLLPAVLSLLHLLLLLLLFMILLLPTVPHLPSLLQIHSSLSPSLLLYISQMNSSGSLHSDYTSLDLYSTGPKNIFKKTDPNPFS